jgi:uncharacterized SAM-binding protein YcdF (DUF218 family)
MSCWWLLLFVWIFFLPITYAIPLFWLERSYFHNSYKKGEAELIVVLGAGLTDSSTMQQPNLNLYLLSRVRFAAFLQRKTDLPILVTGAGSHSTYTEAEIMKQVLEEEFHAHVDFVEDCSHSTLENAKFTVAILREQKIKSIYLVSNSWHLKRASFMFEKYAKEIKIFPLADFAYASKKFNFDRSDFVPSLATPYYQRRFYLEIFRLLWLKIF